MLKVGRIGHPSKYRVRRSPASLDIRLRDLAEVSAAINHYYRERVCNAACPVCAQIAANEKGVSHE